MDCAAHAGKRSCRRYCRRRTSHCCFGCVTAGLMLGQCVHMAGAQSQSSAANIPACRINIKFSCTNVRVRRGLPIIWRGSAGPASVPCRLASTAPETGESRITSTLMTAATISDTGACTMRPEGAPKLGEEGSTGHGPRCANERPGVSAQRCAQHAVARADTQVRIQCWPLGKMQPQSDQANAARIHSDCHRMWSLFLPLRSSSMARTDLLWLLELPGRGCCAALSCNLISPDG